MMIHRIRDQSVVDDLTGYIDSVLGVRVNLTPVSDQGRHATFLTSKYSLYEGYIAGQICIFMLENDESQSTPGDVSKHVKRISSDRDDALAIYIPQVLSTHNRKRLIKHLVPFIVPGNQLYIPELAMDLRERLKRHKRRQTNRLSPTSQAILLSNLLRLDQPGENQGEIAKRLNYSTMSIGRGFDGLEAAGLAEIVQEGRERTILFKQRGRELFEQAAPLLISPVKAVRFVHGYEENNWILLSGECALSRYTDLAHPRRYQYALTAAAWRLLQSRWDEMPASDAGDDAIEIATWAYDPRPLASGPIVDPISLHIIYRNHDDPRVSDAADRVLEMVSWR